MCILGCRLLLGILLLKGSRRTPNRPRRLDDSRLVFIGALCILLGSSLSFSGFGSGGSTMGSYKTSSVFSKLPGSLSQYFLLNSAKFILNSADISFESVVESSWPFSTAESMLINSGEYIPMFSVIPSLDSSLIGFPDETTFTGDPPLRLPHDRRFPKKSLSDSEHREIYFDASLSENLN